jgi:ribosomal protein L3|tara:strand:- start:1181 stop:1561 length:381 start_codon:yes stop_codon:yes gene_type:complete
MQQVLIGLLVALGIFSYFLYSENQTLTANNYKLELAVEEQKAAMTAMKESYEKQGQSLMQMTAQNALIEEEKNKYLDIFRRHNLNQLAEAKPGLIETRINKGTADVFKSIEDDSKELSSLNSSNTP